MSNTNIASGTLACKHPHHSRGLLTGEAVAFSELIGLGEHAGSHGRTLCELSLECLTLRGGEGGIVRSEDVGDVVAGVRYLFLQAGDGLDGALALLQRLHLYIHMRSDFGVLKISYIRPNRAGPPHHR